MDMSGFIDIKLILEKDWPNITVYIKSKERNSDVDGLISAIRSYSDEKIPRIPAYFKGSLVMLPQQKIMRFLVTNRKVIAETTERQYEIHASLQYLEEMLDEKSFARISQSEIVNVKRVKSFDFSPVGTIDSVLSPISLLATLPSFLPNVTQCSISLSGLAP